MISRLGEKIAKVGKSDFGRSAAWFTGLSAFERLIAVIQTILISRTLGITEYGIYGLIFGTIGLLSSVAGLQMGLTATVFVSRYKTTEKMKAGAVIFIVNRFSWMVVILLMILVMPFSMLWSELLLGSDKYQIAIMLGMAFVGASIVSGVQDGIAQGFEIFRSIAKLKIFTSLIAFAAIFPAAQNYGLNGVLSVTLCALIAKYFLLEFAVRKSKEKHNIPKRGAGVSFIDLVSNFAFPSMAVSLAAGAVTWLGMLMLSRQSAGFDSVAIANTGLQWRGPILLLAASLGGVAVPVFSRLSTQGIAEASRLRRDLALVNFCIALAIAIILVTTSGLIMALYGDGFMIGRFAFCLIVLSTIPAVVANVYMQALVGAGRMWRQLWLHVPYLAVTATCFFILVPSHSVMGYAASLLIGATVLLFHVLVADRHEARQRLQNN